MLLRGMSPLTFAEALLAGCRRVPRLTHLFLCVADHFEPDWSGAASSQQQQRVAHWVENYPRSVDSITDSRGRAPQHTFFCPIEVYQPQLIDGITKLVQDGFGDVEIHLHHDNDTAQQLTEQLCLACERLHHRHGLLSKDAQGNIRYGFIHGNWALDNSHPDGRWCGVDSELTILRQTGCYADFTMPAAPHPAQTRTINSIYYAIDDPQQSKSHDTGIAAQVAVEPPAEGLLMIQGPLLVTNPLRGTPRLENGNISGSQPLTQSRLKDLLRAQVTVSGQPNWLFVKLHTHGAPEKNSAGLLGPEMRSFHHSLRSLAEHRSFQWYYVTAREMAQLVRQAELGFDVPDLDALTWL